MNRLPGRLAAVILRLTPPLERAVIHSFWRSRWAREGGSTLLIFSGGRSRKTASLLARHGLRERVMLINDGHEGMSKHIAEPIGAVMFNLGYLPGGDPNIVTDLETTLPALEASLRLLRPGGVITLVLYGGHARGAAEKAAVLDYCAGLEGSAYGVVQTRLLNCVGVPPELVVVKKFRKQPSGGLAEGDNC